MALSRLIPPLQGLFFQEEVLGISLIEQCTDCKLKISQCRICSSDTAILTAAEEEEYNILKEHVIFCKDSGQHWAKYPFKMEPLVSMWINLKTWFPGTWSVKLLTRTKLLT